MRDNGFSDEASQALAVMLPFWGYAFNTSHTAGYGLVASGDSTIDPEP
ncbi:hypothetical protein [Nonomuraea soli]|uniref:DNA polymerase III alpha subunit n=1 Tax=Nonomuraea soli TaxID=1032476 RepID=A0A7W0CH94_9ACTN|nr:hypothetical protein [Nonomuraea soli]MBA2891108.1 DNA polymerase III alpha subunit [Nonomuraea soli]